MQIYGRPLADDVDNHSILALRIGPLKPEEGEDVWAWSLLQRRIHREEPRARRCVSRWFGRPSPVFGMCQYQLFAMVPATSVLTSPAHFSRLRSCLDTDIADADDGRGGNSEGVHR